jgi:hypothetical protein
MHDTTTERPSFPRKSNPRPKALGWQGGYATACKAVDVSCSIPIGGIEQGVGAFHFEKLDIWITNVHPYPTQNW